MRRKKMRETGNDMRGTGEKNRGTRKKMGEIVEMMREIGKGEDVACRHYKQTSIDKIIHTSIMSNNFK